MRETLTKSARKDETQEILSAMTVPVGHGTILDDPLKRDFMLDRGSHACHSSRYGWTLCSTS